MTQLEAPLCPPRSWPALAEPGPEGARSQRGPRASLLLCHSTHSSPAQAQALVPDEPRSANCGICSPRCHSQYKQQRPVLFTGENYSAVFYL